MPSVATGANLADKDMIFLGVSGDGDTASIGIGQFIHIMRRNLNMLYVVENNGCYGLTKGQDSATSDIGSKSKAGIENEFSPVDLVSLALNAGATFIARSFSGDKNQLVPLVQAALRHPGFAIIDIISPCVTFNNTPGSTKSYSYVRQHMEAMDTIDFVFEEEEITALIIGIWHQALIDTVSIRHDMTAVILSENTTQARDMRHSTINDIIEDITRANTRQLVNITD